MEKETRQVITKETTLTKDMKIVLIVPIANSSFKLVRSEIRESVTRKTVVFVKAFELHLVADPLKKINKGIR